MIEAANKKAREALSEAEARTKETLAGAKRQSDADAEKIVNEAIAETETIRSDAERKGWTEGEKLSARADKARDEAVKAAVEIIFG